MSRLDPPSNCSKCRRLVGFRARNQTQFGDWHNQPVAAFGDVTAGLLIVGLAPGLRGANRTGRPFTGDYAGDLLYPTLIEFGFATGNYGAAVDDGLRLVDCRVTNAVRCVPPENKPTTGEIRTCGAYLTDEIAAMRELKVILALGRVAHDAVLASLSLRRARFAFGHGARHALGEITLYDSYHCSRYNTNTGRLTPRMFHDVFAAIRQSLGVIQNG